jgi:hypothetical protein
LDGESYSDWELLYDDSEKDDDDDEEDGNEIPTIKSVEEEIKLLKNDHRNLSVEDSGFCKSDDEINNHATDNVNADEELKFKKKKNKRMRFIINLKKI